MKRLSFVILAAIVLLATVSALLLTACVPWGAPENLIQNPGFEEPPDSNCTGAPDNWTSTGKYTGRSTDAHSGNCSAYIYGANSSYTQTVLIEALAAYRVVAYIKISNATGNVSVMTQDSDGVDLLEAPLVLSGNQTTWAKSLIYLPTLPTAYYAIITLRMEPDDGAIEPKAWFDDILLEEKGECFIATAAYGTPLAGEIEVLRQFRDQYLLPNPAGRLLVSLYYGSSPPLAHLISKHDGLKAVTRMALEPIIWFCSRITTPPGP
ncbi:MAG: hypothetical protein IBX36_00030 [Dehalococcoidia bacterium]|nr:hypothetical protein [Dehalococcoidia bacterium]